MGQNASGMYIVDDSYNIVSFNKVAEQIYPRLKEGEKCYRCLMNQEVPCAMCPIYNKVEGPKTYIDPVSGKYETVDAVEIRLPDGKEGYAVVFGMAESDKEAVNAPIPDGVQGLRLASIINVLGNDYSSIYSVDRQTQQMRSYLESTNADTMTLLNVTQTYTEAIAAYVEENVLPQDQGKLEFAMDFDSLCAHLKRVPQFMVHYRSRRKKTGEVHYAYLKCARVGEADSFDTIALAFANEDADVRRNQL